MPGADYLPIEMNHVTPCAQGITTSADTSSLDDGFDKVFDALNTKPPVTKSPRRDSVMDL